MQIIRVEQDTEEWQEERRPSIGGSDAKSVLPLRYKNSDGDYRSAGFWDFIGRQMTKPSGIIETPMDRGHRLEEEAMLELASLTGLEFDLKPGLWRSDEENRIHISSDGAEPGDKPTYDAEIKCLGDGKHFKYVYKSRNWHGSQLDLVPNEKGSFYREQVLHAFYVNPDLKTRYFMLYNPNVIHQEHKAVLMVINRDEIQEELDGYIDSISQILNDSQRIIEELTSDVF